MASSLTAEQQMRAKHAWVEKKLTDGQIAMMLGVTKNVIIGLRFRQGWFRGDVSRARPRKVYVRRDPCELQQDTETLFDRMDKLEATMDAVLRETQAMMDRSRQQMLNA